MTNGVFLSSGTRSFQVVHRTALAAVRQSTTANRSAIHGQVITVSALSFAAMRAFFRSPWRQRFSSSADHPALLNISPDNRSAFCASDSFDSSP